MVLYTKGIYQPASREDGTRILVMGRLTDNTGKNPDYDLVKGKNFDIWMPSLAPHPAEVGKWHRSEKTDDQWEEFVIKYRAKLRDPNVARQVRNISVLCDTQDITLLCSEDRHERCHRSILAEECKNRRHSLEIIHR